jgi:plasmid stabilization system protein ParE
MQVILAPKTRSDIVSILAWTQENFGPQTLKRYAKLIETAIEDIAADPDFRISNNGHIKRNTVNSSAMPAISIPAHCSYRRLRFPPCGDRFGHLALYEARASANQEDIQSNLAGSNPAGFSLDRRV